MLAALLFGQASAEGAQFFQPPVAGFMSHGSMVSQAVPVPMVPLAGNEMSLAVAGAAMRKPVFKGSKHAPLHFAEQVPSLVKNTSEDGASDQGVVPVSFAVCALYFAVAVAGAAMRKQIFPAAKRATRTNGPPRMSASWNEDRELVRGPVDQVLRYRTAAYLVIFNQGSPNEGVYTLEQKNDRGASVTQILTFEREEDAARFAQSLRGENFNVVGRSSSISMDARPLMWDTRSIAKLCNRGAFEVALVPEGSAVTPPQNNMYDPRRFESAPPSSQDQRFQRPATPTPPSWQTPDWNQYASGVGVEQRRRARDILANTNRKNPRQQARGVWDAAMRNADAYRQANDEEEMCGIEECGMDKYLGERDELERLFGPGHWGPSGPGPSGPGPSGPGPWGPSGLGPWGP
jgi:hypothetical protein